MSFANQPHAGPAGAPPNMAQNFNAMLQRSMDSPQPEHAAEAPGQPPAGPGTSQCLRAHRGRGTNAREQAMEAYTAQAGHHPPGPQRWAEGDQQGRSRSSRSSSRRKRS